MHLDDHRGAGVDNRHGRSGTGNGTVTVTVAANTGGARNDTLTIAGQSFAVTQPKS